MKILSVGCNRKLGKKIGIFNLPAEKTCPGRTKECGRVCYAKKAERIYPNSLAKRRWNHAFANSLGFVQAITDEIRKYGLEKVRIHESGDFYNQRYLNRWIKIAADCPDTRFLAFTKSFHLDFSKIPANLVVICSIDTSTTKVPISGMTTALTLPAGATSIQGRYTCPPVGRNPVTLKKDPDHHNYCGVSCNHCWDNKGPVAWMKH